MRKTINTNMEYDNAYFEGETMWFVERTNNMLCQLDIDKEKLTYHAIVPYGGKGSAYRRHPQCIKYNNYIICIPDRGNSFVVYNIENREFQECEIDTKGCRRISIYNFWIINETLWCVSSGMNSIIEFSLSLCKVLGDYVVLNNSVNKLGVDACLVGKTIICTSINSRELSFFNVDDKTFRYYDVQSEEPGYNSISAVGTKVYLSGYSRHIYVFDIETWETCKIELNRDEFHIFDNNHIETVGFGNHPIFRKSFMGKDFIAFLPWYMPDSLADSIVIFFWETGIIKFYKILCDIYKKEVGYSAKYLYYMRIINENEIEIYLDGQPLRYLNIRDNSVSCVMTEVNNFKYENIFSNKHLTINEVGKNDLKEYIRAIVYSA